MSKIYIVTAGCYSDYRIIAAFSDKEKAIRFCRYHNDNQEDGCEDDSGDYNARRIEEYDLDTDTPDIPVDLVPFKVRMDLEGRVNCERVSFSCLSKQPEISFYSDIMHTNILARDKIHAIKIANERRAALIASDQWGGRDRIVSMRLLQG